MLKPTEDPWITDENPGLTGPDYVALVVEWNDLDDQLDAIALPERVVQPRRVGAMIAMAAAVVGAIAIGVWGIRRLRAG